MVFQFFLGAPLDCSHFFPFSAPSLFSGNKCFGLDSSELLCSFRLGVFSFTEMGKAPCNNQLFCFFFRGWWMTKWTLASSCQVTGASPHFAPPPQHPQRGNRTGTRLISTFGSCSFSSYKSETKYFSIICKTSMKVSEDSWRLCTSPWQQHASQYNHKWKPSED